MLLHNVDVTWLKSGTSDNSQGVVMYLANAQPALRRRETIRVTVKDSILLESSARKDLPQQFATVLKA